MKWMKSLFVAFALLFSLFASAAPVNINTADAETLSAGIVGVGAARAEAIIQYREQNGPFGSVDELTKVSGIGAKTVENNRENLTIDSTE